MVSKMKRSKDLKKPVGKKSTLTWKEIEEGSGGLITEQDMKFPLCTLDELNSIKTKKQRLDHLQKHVEANRREKNGRRRNE